MSTGRSRIPRKRTAGHSIAPSREHGLDWHWSTADYARWLAVTGRQGAVGCIHRIAARSSRRSARRSRRASRPSTGPRRDHYARIVAAGCVPLRDGVKRLLEEAERAGVTLAIASTTTLANIEALLGAHFGAGAAGRFSVIGAGDAVAHKKPAPDIYRFVLREIGESSADCVAIEDSLAGARGRQRRRTVHRGHPEPVDPRRGFPGADLVLPSWDSCDTAAPGDRDAFAPKWGRRPRYAAGGNHEHQRKKDHHRIHDRGAAALPRGHGRFHGGAQSRAARLQAHQLHRRPRCARRRARRRRCDQRPGRDGR